MTSKGDSRTLLVTGLLISLLALWLRLPFIGAGMPYFYHEDEAHHFNRTVNMVKSGDLNPHYFHKPSFHFYLRMPVVAAAFLWTVRKGQIRSVQEIQTEDKFGLAGYAFTASHPGIVKWNRAFSVLLSVGLVVFALLIAWELCGSVFVAGLAGLLTAVSPDLVRLSAVIGVDVPMAFLSMASVYAAVLLGRKFSLSTLWICGLLAGLAVSTKYNALPIALVPLVACIAFNRISAWMVVSAIVSPVIGFFVGSPFIITSLPLFLDQFAYEIWHYGVQGHAGDMAEPGLPQAAFYSTWLLSDGLGMIAILGLLGFAASVAKQPRKAVVALVFPCLFLALMIGQRANFTRNMLVFVPFAALLTAAAFLVVDRFFKRVNILIPVCVALLVAAQPFVGSLTVHRAAAQLTDSRDAAYAWLHTNAEPLVDTALSGELQLPRFVYTSKGVSRLSLPGASRVNPAQPLIDLYQQGFSRIVLGPERTLTDTEEALVTLEQSFPGANNPQRVVKNPSIQVYRFRDDLFQTALQQSELPVVSLTQNLEGELSSRARFGSDTAPTENYSWLTQRVNKLTLLEEDIVQTGRDATVTCEMMSPWPNQILTVSKGDWQQQIALSAGAPGTWQQVALHIPAQALSSESDGILAAITQVHSPQSQSGSGDTRRLGIAIRNCSVT